VEQIIAAAQVDESVRPLLDRTLDKLNALLGKAFDIVGKGNVLEGLLIRRRRQLLPPVDRSSQPAKSPQSRRS